MKPDFLDKLSKFLLDLEGVVSKIGYKSKASIKSCQFLRGLQHYIDNAIMSISGFKGLQVERKQDLLFVRDIHLGVCEKSPNVNLELISSAQTSSHLQARDTQPAFECSPVTAADAELVNTFWVNGGNETSLKIVRQCIAHLPTWCMRDPEGKPITWCIMDQTAEIRMGYTMPEYRGRGLPTSLLTSFFDLLKQQQHDFPFHFITAKGNVQVHSVARKVDLRNVPSGYHQWTCWPQGKANIINKGEGLVREETPAGVFKISLYQKCIFPKMDDQIEASLKALRSNL
ncbi:glycine N-phenylacetyltransferase-like [Lissotriton helveticus]